MVTSTSRGRDCGLSLPRRIALLSALLLTGRPLYHAYACWHTEQQDMAEGLCRLQVAAPLGAPAAPLCCLPACPLPT